MAMMEDLLRVDDGGFTLASLAMMKAVPGGQIGAC